VLLVTFAGGTVLAWHESHSFSACKGMRASVNAEHGDVTSQSECGIAVERTFPLQANGHRKVAKV
jgi:hypothetical protein